MNNGNKQSEIAGIPAAEWSAILQRHPSLATPDFQKWLTPKWVWLSAALSKAGPPSSTARLLIAALATRMNGKCFCYPSIEMLAEETGLSNRAILNHVATLNGRWLEVTTRQTGGMGRPRNSYAALIPNEFPTEVIIERLAGRTNLPITLVNEVHETNQSTPSDFSEPHTDFSEPHTDFSEPHTDFSERGSLEVSNEVSKKLVRSKKELKNPPISPQGGKAISQPSLLVDSEPQRPPVASPKKNGHARDEAFARFWEAYPRKVAKHAARQVFDKIKIDPETLDRIVAAADAYRKKVARDGTDPQYIKHPSGWLNARRWEDEPEPERYTLHHIPTDVSAFANIAF